MLASTSTVNSHAPLGAKTGLSLLSASVFIVGEMAGSGILALPNAIANAGQYLGKHLVGGCFWPVAPVVAS